jgi:hypothetical protein
VFECPETVEHERLLGTVLRSQCLMEEEAVAAEALAQATNRGVRDLGLASNLAKARARDQAVEDGFEELGSPEPIADREGRGREVSVAV